MVTKFRSGKVSQLLILAIFMTMFFGVGASSAYTGNYGKMTISQSVNSNISTVTPDYLGFVKVEIDAANAVTGNVQLEMTLPNGVVFDNSDPLYQSDKIFTASNPVSPGTDFVWIIFDSVLPAVVVDSTVAAHDIEVNTKVTYKNNDGIDIDSFNEPLILAKWGTEAVNVTAASPKVVSPGNDQEVARITFKENTPGSMEVGSKVAIQLPAGFEWSQTTAPIITQGLVELAFADPTYSADDMTMYFAVAAASVSIADQVRVKAYVNVNPTAPSGDMIVQVFDASPVGITSNLNATSLTVATVIIQNDASLSSLIPSAGSLSPAFDADTLEYTLNVENRVSSIAFTPTNNDSNAAVAVDGNTVASGGSSQAIDLVAGIPKDIAVIVTAADGVSTTTYTITATRSSISQAPEFVDGPGTYSGAVDVCLPGTLELRPFYTIDGSDPATSPTRIYGGEHDNYVYIDSSTSLRAVFSYLGDPNNLGPETFGSYEIVPIPAPTLSLVGGVVSITNFDDVMGSNATYYTVDGTDPTTSSTSTQYSAPISVDSSQTVKAAFVRHTRTYLPGGISNAEEGPLWGPVSILGNADYVDVKSGYSSINNGNNQEAGSIQVTSGDDYSLVAGQLNQLLVELTLPTGIIFSSVNDVEVAGGTVQNRTANSILISADSTTNPLIIISNPYLDVDPAFAGDIFVNIRTRGLDSTSNEIFIENDSAKIAVVIPSVKFNVTASAVAGGGTVSPSSQEVTAGQSASITITPDAGYKIASITDNGNVMAINNPYVINNVTANHDVVVVFEPLSAIFTVNASIEGVGGTLSPTSQGINRGSSASITVTPDTGYKIASIADNGNPVIITNPYIIENVVENHDVIITFKTVETEFTVTVSSSGFGTVSPAYQVVQAGKSATIFINPNPGYYIRSISEPDVRSLNDGANGYIVDNVTRNHNISVAFYAIPNLEAEVNDNWTWRNPMPQGNDLNCIAYGNGIYVAGGLGAIATSTDGVNWTFHPISRTIEINGLAFGNGRFIALAYEYNTETGEEIRHLLKSSNGENWTISPYPDAYIFNVVYENGKFFALGVYAYSSESALFTSNDGDTWTKTELPGSVSWLLDLAYGNGSFIAQGAGGMFTSRDGVNWALSYSGISGFTDITYDDKNGLFIACSYQTILTSPDGQTWTPATIDNPNQKVLSFNDVMASDSGDVALCDEGYTGNGQILYSSNGLAWEITDAHTPSHLEAGTVQSGEFYAVGDGGTIISSIDGVTWTERTGQHLYSLNDVTYTAGKFIAVGTDSDQMGIVLTSPDGIIWSEVTPQNAHSLSAIAYSRGELASVGGYQILPFTGDFATLKPTTIMSSDGGNSWIHGFNTNPYEYIGAYCDVALGKGNYVAVGSSPAWCASYKVMSTSTDGISWTLVSDPVVNGFGNFTSISYGKGIFVAGGGGGGSTSNGIIVNSTDGLNWAYSPVSTWEVGSIAYGNGRFLLLGGQNLLTSADGLNWEKHSRAVEKLFFNNGIFMATTQWGREILWSLDGINWNTIPGITIQELRAASYGNDTIVAVGNCGTILQSEPLGLGIIVSASTAGGHGLVTPEIQQVESGGNATVTITPESGYKISMITDNDVEVPITNTYMIENVTEYHDVVVWFDAITTPPGEYTVTASVVGGHGSVSPASQKVLSGQNASITITPDSGYQIASINDNQSSALNNTSPYVINNVTENHDIVVQFKLIAASAKAVIIIPGIMGSELFWDRNSNKEIDDNDQQVWLPLDKSYQSDIAALVCDPTNGDSIENIVTGNPFQVGYPYAFWLADYDVLYNRIQESGDLVFFFGYDWRLDNKTNADRLKSLVDTINTMGFAKVDIVAHSMGGLVAAQYIKNGNADKVDKLITLGTPYLGSPKSLYMCETGKLFLGPLDRLTEVIIQAVIPNMESVYQLLPNQDYFNYSDSYYVQGYIDNPGQRNDFETVLTEYAATNTLIKQRSWTNDTLLDNNRDFVSDLELIQTLSKVHSYFIVGDKQTTAGEIRLGTRYNGRGDKPVEYCEIATNINGDGTVPLISATIGGKTDTISPNHTYYVDCAHGKLIDNDWVILQVLNILDGHDGVMVGMRDHSETTGTLKLVVDCPVVVDIYDDNNNHTGVINEYVYEEGIPGSSYYVDKLGDGTSKTSAFLIDDDYTVDLKGTGEGQMDFEIDRYDEDNNLIKKVIFNDIPITQMTRMKSRIDLDNAIVLQLDQDGNGSIDKVITPSLSIDGNPSSVAIGIDVMPDSSANSVSLKKNGNLPLAIFGTDNFNIMYIDPTTIELGGVEIADRAKFTNNAFSYEDINRDGRMDMICHFRISDLVTANAISSDTKELIVTAYTLEGELLTGTDSIKVIKTK